MSDEFEQLRQLKLQQPINYYRFWDLEADYSKPGLVSPEKQQELIEKALSGLTQLAQAMVRLRRTERLKTKPLT
jgi:hypothetical protein